MLATIISLLFISREFFPQEGEMGNCARLRAGVQDAGG